LSLIKVGKDKDDDTSSPQLNLLENVFVPEFHFFQKHTVTDLHLLTIGVETKNSLLKLNLFTLIVNESRSIDIPLSSLSQFSTKSLQHVSVYKKKNAKSKSSKYLIVLVTDSGLVQMIQSVSSSHSKLLWYRDESLGHFKQAVIVDNKQHVPLKSSEIVGEDEIPPNFNQRIELQLQDIKVIFIPFLVEEKNSFLFC
jgi:hypothetical protein